MREETLVLIVEIVVRSVFFAFDLYWAIRWFEMYQLGQRVIL